MSFCWYSVRVRNNKGGIFILVKTHRVVAAGLADNIEDLYDIKLDKESLAWGSILPDYHPMLRFKRHYAEESLDFVIDKVVSLIFTGRFIDIENGIFSGISNKILSRNIGIIIHYLADFTCRPHYERWTYLTDPLRHMRYEKELCEKAQNHNFNRPEVYPVEHVITGDGKYELRESLRSFFEDALGEYGEGTGMARDLDFALAFSTIISMYMLDTIKQYDLVEELRSTLNLEFMPNPVLGL